MYYISLKTNETVVVVLEIDVPVIHETQMDPGSESARAICSGKMEGTRFTRRGWEWGRSSLPVRREGSKGTVMG
jgi:hypothetical protein